MEKVLVKIGWVINCGTQHRTREVDHKQLQLKAGIIINGYYFASEALFKYSSHDQQLGGAEEGTELGGRSSEKALISPGFN